VDVVLAAPALRQLDHLTSSDLARAGQYVTVARRLVLAHGLAPLEPVELPPVTADAARSLAELAPMYFLAELDAAGLFLAGDRLAGRFAEGGLSLPSAGSTRPATRHGASRQPADVMLAELWRGRHKRFAETERAALFGRLFGGNGPTLPVGGRNDSFELLLARFADSVIGATPSAQGRGRWEARGSTELGLAAQRLAVAAAGYGMAVPRLASEDLLNHAQLVLAIIQDPDVQAAVGERSAWGVVAALRDPTRSGRGTTEAALVTHVSRARAGLTLLGWLAEVVGSGDRRRLPAPPNEVTDAAFDWLEATLGTEAVAP
jgi:hypothetical protein